MNRVGLGDAELDVDGVRLFPVTAGLAGFTGGVTGVAKTVMGTGLQVAVAYLRGQAERDVVMGAGVAGTAGGEEDGAEAVRRPCTKPGCPALLQVTDHSDTDARRPCELSLGESGRDPVRADPAPGGS